MTTFDSAWMQTWQDAVNRDPTMKIVGRYMNTDFLIGFDGDEYLVSVRDGKVERVTGNVTIEHPWDFALRGPKQSWEKFIQPVPPPMYNDIWAMAHPLHGRLKMEGNVKVLWQNLRALTWMLDRMREVKMAA